MPADVDPALDPFRESLGAVLIEQRAAVASARPAADRIGFTFAIGEPVIDTVTGQIGTVTHARHTSVIHPAPQPQTR